MTEKSKQSDPTVASPSSSATSARSSVVPRRSSGTPASSSRSSTSSITAGPPARRGSLMRAREAARSRFAPATNPSSPTKSDPCTYVSTERRNSSLGEHASSSAVSGVTEPQTMRHAGTSSKLRTSASNAMTSVSPETPSPPTSSMPSCVNCRGWPESVDSSRTTGAL